MNLGVLLSLCFFTVATHAATLQWYTDFDQAKAAAQADHKTILLDFTGSDWCGWCQKLKAEVFDTPEFAAYAADKLILVEVDFPHAKPLSEAQKAANDQLAANYHINGYPTIILLDSQGKPCGKTGYIRGGPKPFLANLNTLITPGQSQPSAVVSGAQPVPEPPSYPKNPLYGASAPKATYAELQLKGITGPKKQRLALINGSILATGEEAKITIADKTLKVKCVEISDSAVKLLVDGEPKELELNR